MLVYIFSIYFEPCKVYFIIKRMHNTNKIGLFSVINIIIIDPIPLLSGVYIYSWAIYMYVRMMCFNEYHCELKGIYYWKIAIICIFNLLGVPSQQKVFKFVRLYKSPIKHLMYIITFLLSISFIVLYDVVNLCEVICAV